jgi:S1-C subfamily serine protease
MGIILSFFPTAPSANTELNASVIVEGRVIGHGSGVFISPTQVLTAGHVADFVVGNGVIREVDGRLHQIVKYIIDKDADLGVITVDPPFTGIVPKTSCAYPNRGDRLHYYGNPGVLEFVGPIYLHYIGGAPRERGDPTFTVLVDGAIVNGASGSGVLNEAGEVIGVVTVEFLDPFDQSDGHLSPTGIGGYVSLHYPEVCEFITAQL